jgi:hypothetical protein
MKKYNWALFKTLEFLSSRRPDIELRPSYVNQLANLEARLERGSRKTSKWNEVSNENPDGEEVLLTNT